MDLKALKVFSSNKRAPHHKLVAIPDQLKDVAVKPLSVLTYVKLCCIGSEEFVIFTFKSYIVSL